MSYALAGENCESKRKRQDMSEVSQQQRWSRKQQMHTNITQAVSFLEEEGVSLSSVTLVYNETGKLDSLNLDSGKYSDIDVDGNSRDENPEITLFVKDCFGLSDIAYHGLSMVLGMSLFCFYFHLFFFIAIL